MAQNARAIARILGVSHVALLKAASRGRIPREPDGTFDLEKVQAAWSQNTDARKQRGKKPVTGVPHSDPQPEKTQRRELAVPPVVSDDATTESPSDLPDVAPCITFLELQRRREAIRLQSDELKLSRMRGELIEREQTNLWIQNVAIAEKEAILNWPSRVAAGMSAELGIEERSLRAVLEREIRKFLSERSGPPPSL